MNKLTEMIYGTNNDTNPDLNHIPMFRGQIAEFQPAGTNNGLEPKQINNKIKGGIKERLKKIGIENPILTKVEEEIISKKEGLLNNSDSISEGLYVYQVGVEVFPRKHYAFVGAEYNNGEIIYKNTILSVDKKAYPFTKSGIKKLVKEEMEKEGQVRNSRVVQMIDMLLEENVETDIASPEFVADFAWNRGITDLYMGEIIEISNRYENNEEGSIDIPTLDKFGQTQPVKISGKGSFGVDAGNISFVDMGFIRQNGGEFGETAQRMGKIETVPVGNIKIKYKVEDQQGTTSINVSSGEVYIGDICYVFDEIEQDKWEKFLEDTEWLKNLHGYGISIETGGDGEFKVRYTLIPGTLPEQEIDIPTLDKFGNLYLQPSIISRKYKQPQEIQSTDNINNSQLAGEHCKNKKGEIKVAEIKVEGLSNRDLISRYIDGAVRGNSSSLSIQGDILYSYDTPIAIRKEGKIYANPHRYSVTTSINQNRLKGYTSDVEVVPYAQFHELVTGGREYSYGRLYKPSEEEEEEYRGLQIPVLERFGQQLFHEGDKVEILEVAKEDKEKDLQVGMTGVVVSMSHTIPLVSVDNWERGHGEQLNRWYFAPRALKIIDDSVFDIPVLDKFGKLSNRGVKGLQLEIVEDTVKEKGYEKGDTVEFYHAGKVLKGKVEEKYQEGEIYQVVTGSGEMVPRLYIRGRMIRNAISD